MLDLPLERFSLVYVSNSRVGSSVLKAEDSSVAFVELPVSESFCPEEPFFFLVNLPIPVTMP